MVPPRPARTPSGLRLGVALAADPRAVPAGRAEEAAAAAMPPRRRREFLAGRLAARRALRAAGLECGEIPRAGRLPRFPPGRAASIAHSAGVAVAVARVPGPDLPLGCDLELRPLPASAARLVLREDEAALLRAARPGAAPWSVTALFSAKEAAWKALHTGPRALPDGALRSLRDLRARPDGAALRIEVRGDGARAVRVAVAPLGVGVFSTVLGWAER
ncbi:4'-phosphopantetheinyl transferase superfamily protein [Streptomyces sp. TRM 70351]|uniref:4'-phosphopantetheinyl transferase superfamily protein n=1 Tax=Streptomyces sp. TRM 70351 TaxID=3116552 RepID=UPI002E7B6B8C|nr:4'-phosphopantetheinyl transferase superfamily protein [Streptomyces sp. TRM 70351]MEE1928328.1 4'-phosphopantetheinyl transferase superfamily protein [Streptomyces sp. TRM 70351]